MALEMVYYPDPRLREVSKPVRRVEDLKEHLPAMFEIMYKHRGIGLAGPQAGLMLRVIVANITGDPKQKDQEHVFVNPVIVDRSGEMREPEGCLSLPGVEAVLKRSDTLHIELTDLEGRRQQFEATGLYAKLFQHEIDHLDGILLLDRMSAAEKKQWTHLVRELEEDYERTQQARKQTA